MIRTINCLTGEITEREMTPEEISFAKIFAECQNNLFEKISNKETFEIITENEFE